tara:strand:+ start:304 stop:555 length:252 start_codon:yes stop_codon:yes gene_type:complete
VSLPDLSALAVPGALLAVRATPKARRNGIEPGDPVRVWVTAPPDRGKANDAVRRLLAKALGIAPTRLTLTRGAESRDKQFQMD